MSTCASFCPGTQLALFSRTTRELTASPDSPPMKRPEGSLGPSCLRGHVGASQGLGRKYEHIYNLIANFINMKVLVFNK